MAQAFKLTDQTSAPPSDEDRRIAAESSRQLAALIGKSDKARLHFIDGGEAITVPVSAMRMFVDILMYMAEGEAVTITPRYAEVTTQQGAEFLNVSRPFFVKLLEEGKLDFHKVGTHRRVYFRDLVAYKEQSMGERQKAVKKLAKQAQELNLGY